MADLLQQKFMVAKVQTFLDAARVQSWVETALDAEESGAVAAMKTNLDAQISEKITPTTVTKKLG